MAKRSEIFKALLAQGWQLMGAGEACLLLHKGDHYEAELYLDSLNFSWGVMLNEGDEHERGFYIGFALEHIWIQDGKLILPERGFCPYCDTCDD